jgi:hypothetical protein
MTKQTLLSILILSLCCNQLQAQEPAFCIKTGINRATMRIATASIERTQKLFSFHLGAYADLPLTASLWLQPGLLLSGKGAKTQLASPTDVTFYNASSNPVYLELPVHIVLKMPLNESARFFIGAGPYVALGIAGKRKAVGKLATVEYDLNERIVFSNDVPPATGRDAAGFGQMRRFDYGIGATAGIEGSRAVFSIGYGLGLAQLRSGSGNDEKHRVLSFSIGYRFAKNGQ